MKDWTRGLWTGLGAGAVVAAVLPFAVPVLAEIVRPLTKAVLKQSWLGGDRLRTHAARLSEELADLLAEVRVEVAQELEASGKAQSKAIRAVASTPEARVRRAHAKKVVS